MWEAHGLPPTLLSSAHACNYSRLLRHPICNVTNENYTSFPERVRNCSYNLFFSVQLASYFKKTEFLQGEEKGAAGKGEAVDEGNHTEALESKSADARSLEGWACGTGTGGAEHSVQRARVKTWGPPKRRQQQGHWAYAQSCPHNELVTDWFSLSSSTAMPGKNLLMPKEEVKHITHALSLESD